MSDSSSQDNQQGFKLAAIFGRALMNGDFLDKLKTNPSDAVRDMNISLEEDEVTLLKSIDYSLLQNFKNNIDSFRGGWKIDTSIY